MEEKKCSSICSWTPTEQDEFIFVLFLKEEGLNFHLKQISFQNSTNSIFGEFSKVRKNTLAQMEITYMFTFSS